MYDLTNLTNATGMYEMTYATNELSNGYLGIFIQVSVFLLFFIVHKRFTEDTKTVFFTSSMLTMISTMLLYTLGLIGNTPLIMNIVLVFGSFIIYKMSD